MIKQDKNHRHTSLLRSLLLAWGLSMSSLLLAETLSIEQCREQALSHNKDRQQAALTTQQAEYTRRATHALFFPDFSLMGLGIYDTGKGSQMLDFNSVLGPTLYSIGTWAAGMGMQLPDISIPDYELDYKFGFLFSGGVMMKQPIYMGGKIRAGYSMAETAVAMARVNERLTDAQVIQQADEAYAQVVKAEQLVKVAQSYQRLLEELDRNVESAIRHGLKMQNDRTKVQVKMSEVELNLRRAENGVRLAKMNLCHIIGRPLDESLQVDGTYPEVDDAQTLQGYDISARPELALLDYKTELAAKELKVVKSEMLPQVALLAKYGYTNGLEFNNRTLLDGWNFAGGVTVSIPLYHFGERANKVKAAQVKQQQAQLERENKAELMQLELAQAANKLDEARLEKQLAEKSLAQCEENMHLSKQQYDAGFETLSAYLESQAQWQQANETSVDASYRLYLASVAYLKAAGRLVE